MASLPMNGPGNDSPQLDTRQSRLQDISTTGVQPLAKSPDRKPGRPRKPKPSAEPHLQTQCIGEQCEVARQCQVDLCASLALACKRH